MAQPCASMPCDQGRAYKHACGHAGTNADLASRARNHLRAHRRVKTPSSAGPSHLHWRKPRTQEQDGRIQGSASDKPGAQLAIAHGAQCRGRPASASCDYVCSLCSLCSRLVCSQACSPCLNASSSRGIPTLYLRCKNVQDAQKQPRFQFEQISAPL